MESISARCSDEINKRLTLNLLIQGSAEHAFLTSHYLVKDDLDAIDRRLLPKYDSLTLAASLQYWRGVTALVMGSPRRFWKNLARSSHLFSRHPFLVRHGGMLAEASRLYALKRAEKQRLWSLPGFFSVHVSYLVVNIPTMEERHSERLVALARKVACEIWNFPEERVDAVLTKQVAFGRLTPPKNFKEILLRDGAVGYGGVMRYGSSLHVVARARFWPFLVHEIVKGVAELICLHGLNTLDDDTYRVVTGEADKLIYETWMLQVGPELWRRLLALTSPDLDKAQLLMKLAQLPPAELEQVMMNIVENPHQARKTIDAL